MNLKENMARNNITSLFTISFFLMFFGGCSLNNYKQNINQILEKEKSTFSIDTKKSNLLDHFPSSIKNNDAFLETNPPSCPPSYSCSAQFGDVILIVDKPSYQDELSALLAEKIAYKTAYKDSNIIINLSELRGDVFPIEKCNKWHLNKLPIPYFESYDFGKGKTVEKKEVDGDTLFDYTHSIPLDLQVYVIQAEPGNFWKENCNEKRPETLKEWQHGYSKGFAVSEKNNIIAFWVIIW